MISVDNMSAVSLEDMKPTKHISAEMIADFRRFQERQEELSRRIDKNNRRLQEIAAELRAARLGRGV